MPSAVYSFSDVRAVIYPPGRASFTINGKGIGDITVNWAADNTEHNRAADGIVMPSKIIANDGEFTITAQQTSDLHRYLMDTFNFLYRGETQAWAQTRVDITSNNGQQDNIQLSGVSFKKRGDRAWATQGQMVTWAFMFTDGHSIGSALSNVRLSTSATIL